MFLNQGPIAMSVIVLIIGAQIWLFRSRWGLRTRAVGEHPRAAETVGIDVIRLRYRNVMIGGVFAGLGGAFLSIEATNSFQIGMTNGRGFIALAAMIMGRWTPLGAFASALLFATFLQLGQLINIAPPGGDLGTVMSAVPAQLFDALPYILTIVDPGRRRRPERPAGRRRPAVRAGVRDLTAGRHAGAVAASGSARPAPSRAVAAWRTRRERPRHAGRARLRARQTRRSSPTRTRPSPGSAPITR